MCCLFGIYNYSGSEIKGLAKVTNSLAREATARGMDATGIAYNHKGNLLIHKEPKSAYSITFRHPEDVTAIMGHTRHTTQGNEKHNFNNHPFPGTCKNLKFALAHNGILINDKMLRRNLKLPKTKIETDSFIAVQILESQKQLNDESIKYMAEKVDGSFSFTILDSSDTLWLVKGDSPLSIIHFPKQKVYVYASTDEILYKALVGTEFFKEIKNGEFEEIDIQEGQIIKILPDGTIVTSRFNYINGYYGDYCWWRYGSSILGESTYLDDLKNIAKGYGYDSETIDELLSSGFTTDEIEEYIYCCE